MLVGAVLLTVYHNCGGQIDYPWAMEEMVRRGREVPGGICGFWGCCGAAVSTGIAFSVMKKATPLKRRLPKYHRIKNGGQMTNDI